MGLKTRFDGYVSQQRDVTTQDLISMCHNKSLNFCFRSINQLNLRTTMCHFFIYVRTDWVNCSVLMPGARDKIIQTIRKYGYTGSDLLNARDIFELQEMGFDFAADKLMLVLAEHTKRDSSLFAMIYRYNGKLYMSRTMVSMDCELSRCMCDLGHDKTLLELIAKDTGYHHHLHKLRFSSYVRVELPKQIDDPYCGLDWVCYVFILLFLTLTFG